MANWPYLLFDNTTSQRHTGKVYVRVGWGCSPTTPKKSLKNKNPKALGCVCCFAPPFPHHQEHGASDPPRPTSPRGREPNRDRLKPFLTCRERGASSREAPACLPSKALRKLSRCLLAQKKDHPPPRLLPFLDKL